MLLFLIKKVTKKIKAAEKKLKIYIMAKMKLAPSSVQSQAVCDLQAKNITGHW